MNNKNKAIMTTLITISLIIAIYSLRDLVSFIRQYIQYFKIEIECGYLSKGQIADIVIFPIFRTGLISLASLFILVTSIISIFKKTKLLNVSVVMFSVFNIEYLLDRVLHSVYHIQNIMNNSENSLYIYMTIIVIIAIVITVLCCVSSKFLSVITIILTVLQSVLVAMVLFKYVEHIDNIYVLLDMVTTVLSVVPCVISLILNVRTNVPAV